MASSSSEYGNAASTAFDAASGSASPGYRLGHLALNLLVFSLCYLLANALAQRLDVQRHLVFGWERGIPFSQWMIVPYMSSGPLFLGAFLLLPTADRLRVFSQRMLMASVLAALVFVLFPLRFSWGRPAVDAPLCAALFQLLGSVDQPYNQLPSLHVAYCLLFWSALAPRLRGLGARLLLALWLLLTALATLFTFQHHAADLAGGLALGLLCMATVRQVRSEPAVAFYYLTGAVMVVVLGLCAGQLMALPYPARYLSLYVAACLALVALAYARRDRHFLHKRHGRHPWWTWLLYGPYLAGYRLTWLAVLLRERGKPVVRQLAPGLWVGRRLGEGEALLLPPHCVVFDLANELSETAALRTPRYRHFPLLDLMVPPADAVRDIVAAVTAEIAAGRTVYLHCAMGYSRCIVLANSYLAQASR
ncbi:phosphatase PAP2 family protein [Oxalobacteraceae bacterium]|nr:phosphatase PAP2 family protein [Oxalobacteraceae bacterium]